MKDSTRQGSHLSGDRWNGATKFRGCDATWESQCVVISSSFFFTFWFFFFLIEIIDHVGLGQSPQKRLAYWSPANITAKSSKSLVFAAREKENLNPQSQLIDMSAQSFWKSSALAGYPLPCHIPTVLNPRHQVVDESGRLLLNPHCYEKQCLVAGSSTGLQHVTKPAWFYTKITSNERRHNCFSLQELRP